MDSSPPPPSASSSGNPEDKLRHLPEAARASFHRFAQNGDLAELDVVIYAILEDYMPRKPDKPLAEFPAGTLLIDELGFDSLAITEVVFYTEELLNIAITNEEIVTVRTLGDLRDFVRGKVSARRAA